MYVGKSDDIEEICREYVLWRMLAQYGGQTAQGRVWTPGANRAEISPVFICVYTGDRSTLSTPQIDIVHTVKGSSGSNWDLLLIIYQLLLIDSCPAWRKITQRKTGIEGEGNDSELLPSEGNI
jgi:hypothetical protein